MVETIEAPVRDGPAIEAKDKEQEMARIAQQEESRRDMVDRIAGIDAEDQAEIMFQDTSPPRPMTVLYAVQDGEPVVMTRKRARGMLTRKFPDGRYMFIAPLRDGTKPDHIPEYRLGSVMCFMHPDSPERKELDSLGLAGKTCPKEHLANAYAKRIHQRSTHKRESEVWQEAQDTRKEQEAIERQDRQYEAMLAVAQSVSGNNPAPAEPAPVVAEPLTPCPAEGCNYQGTSAQLRGHKSVHSS